MTMTMLFRSQGLFMRGETRFAECQPSPSLQRKRVPSTSSSSSSSKIFGGSVSSPAPIAPLVTHEELLCDAVMTEGSGTFQAFQESDMIVEDRFQEKRNAPVLTPLMEEPKRVALRIPARRQRNLFKVALMMQAEQGNVKAMERVGRCYSQGLKGFEQDAEKAFLWYARATKAGSVPAMAKMGELLVLGEGVEQDEGKGVMYIALAAGKGSNFASFLMGEYLAEGKHGIDVDLAEARRMLEASLSDKCPYNHMHFEMKEEARQTLKEVLNRIRFVQYMTTA